MVPLIWPRRGRRTGARGAAAVEFVLVAPIFFASIGFLIALGLALMTKYRLYGAVTSTVRTCTAMQRTGDSVGTLSSCVSTQFPVVVTILGGGQLGCDSVPQVQVMTPTMVQTGASGVAGDNKRIYLVQAQVSCKVTINPLTNILGAVMPSQITVSAASAMPFVLGGR